MLNVKKLSLIILVSVLVSLLVSSQIGNAGYIGDSGTVIRLGKFSIIPYSHVVEPFNSTHYQSINASGYVYQNTNASIVINAAYGNMTSGGTLFIKAGSYAVNGLNPANNTVTWGEGLATKLVLPNGFSNTSTSETTNVFYISNKTNVEIAWLEIDGNQSAYATYATGNVFCGIKTYSSTNLDFHNLYIHDIRRTGILIWGAGEGSYFPVFAEVYDCQLNLCNWDGLEAADCSDVTFRDSDITGTSDVLMGIWECKRITMARITGHDGNRAVGSTNGQNIMSFDGDSPTTYPNYEISLVDCIFWNFDGEGVLLLDGTTDSLVHGCKFYNVSGPVIYEPANNKYVRNFAITNNIFEYCGWGDNLSVIWLESTPNYGFYEISHNIINNTERTGGTALYSDAICLKNTTYANIKDNHIINCYTRGISLTYCSNVTVAYNYILDTEGTASDTGIREVSNGYWNVIEHNYLQGISTGVTRVGSNTVVRWNSGYKTEASGNATIATGENHVHVSHGMVASPAFILITCTNSTAVCYSVTSKSATEFVITMSSDSGGGDVYYQTQTWNYP